MYMQGSNCDQKSQLSEILTEPLNPRGISKKIFFFQVVQFYFTLMTNADYLGNK